MSGSRRNAGALAPFVGGYSAWLAQHGYSSAYYGDVRFCRSAGSGGGGLPSTELVVRIRRRWHDNGADRGPRERA